MVYLCTIWQVIDIVVDVSLWSDIFKNIPPKLGEIAQIGTLCRDINMPYDAPDNCETALPFLVMNATDEGYKGYLYLQHTSYFDYAISTGMDFFERRRAHTVSVRLAFKTLLFLFLAVVCGVLCCHPEGSTISIVARHAPFFESEHVWMLGRYQPRILCTVAER